MKKLFAIASFFLSISLIVNSCKSKTYCPAYGKLNARAQTSSTF